MDLGFAEREIVEAIVALAREDGRPIGQALVEGNVIDSQQLAKALAERNGLDYVDLSQFEVDYAAASLITGDEIRRYRAIPIAFIVTNSAGRHGRPFQPAWARQREDRDPAKDFPGDLLTGTHPGADRSAFPVVDSAQEIELGVGEGEEEETEGFELEASADDGPVVKYVHSIIADAVTRGASDVHLEPRAQDLRVRYRIDGVMVDSPSVPRRMAAGVISRLKIMAESISLSAVDPRMAASE